MLIAAVSALRAFRPAPCIVSSILGASTYLDRCVLGLYHCTDPFTRPRRLCLATTLGKFAVRRYGAIYGIVPDEQIELFFDMSGYAYADRWTVAPIREKARYYKHLKRMGKKIIMLPQAFGPFETGECRRWMKALIANVDTVFARDSFSLSQVRDLTEDQEKLKLAPEFTQVLKASLDSWAHIEGLDNAVAIVPNIQMVRQGATNFEGYQNFLLTTIAAIQESGLEPVILQFSREADSQLVNQISLSCPHVRTIRSPNPLIVKGILGEVRAAICSRYHSLVSAYSQGVPAAFTAWSHKYVEFARDYGMDEFILSTGDSREKISRVINELAQNRHAVLRSALLEKAKQNCSLIRAMWESISALLGAELPKDGDISSPKVSWLCL